MVQDREARANPGGYEVVKSGLGISQPLIYFVGNTSLSLLPQRLEFRTQSLEFWVQG